ncbi:MAG: hypothetical protein B7X11_00605 [Acidobacteria bacterium 37-65-4]|nr:MAG: hypothetical protein B7X11_00605 [Acidobacteria bacterium 37-65-4]HQT95506.1 hypothetical protein [Thermoanaerobaculaceae bacterium]
MRFLAGGRALGALRPWLALSAALLSIAAGLIPWRDSGVGRADWEWRVALAGVEDAPATPGSHAVVVPPPDATKETRVFWVYEARWRRPDIYWCLPEEWPLPTPPNLQLTVGAAQPPDGWTVIWRRNKLQLVERGSAK